MFVDVVDGGLLSLHVAWERTIGVIGPTAAAQPVTYTCVARSGWAAEEKRTKANALVDDDPTHRCRTAAIVIVEKIVGAMVGDKIVIVFRIYGAGGWDMREFQLVLTNESNRSVA